MNTLGSVAAYFEQWIAFQQRFRRVPGCQIAVFADGEVVLSNAFGHADVERGVEMTTDHLFRVASHSKTFTATAILQLQEAGTLRLDDAASQWVGYLKDTPLAAVTIRELLAHQSGIFRDTTRCDFWQLDGEFLDDDQLREVLLSAESKVFDRNEIYKYSNITFSLLGLVIEKASGISFNDYLVEHIVKPLGLADVGPELDPARENDYAVGYSSLHYADSRVPLQHVDTRAMAAATGVYSTAASLVRYFAAHFPGDNRILTDDSKRQMQQPISDTGSANRRYGLGIAVATIGERQLVGHSGGYPGHITNSLFDPKAKIAASVLTNAIDGPAGGWLEGFYKLLNLAEKNRDVATDQDLTPYTGRFTSLWGVTDIANLGGVLYLLKPAADDPSAEPVRLEIVDEDTLRIASGPGGGSVGELVEYQRDGDGTIATVRIAGTTHQHLDGYVLSAQGVSQRSGRR